MYTLEQIKDWKTSLNHKATALVDSCLEKLQQDGHLKSFMEIWNATKYNQTVNELKDSLKSMFDKAMDKEQESKSNKLEWLEVANDCQGIRIQLCQLTLECDLEEAVDKAFKNLSK